MAFMHISTDRLGARALAAARLVERATTEPEREAAAGLVTLVRSQGVAAASITIPAMGNHLRLSDDGLLMVGACVWWPCLMLLGMAQALGFDPTGKTLEQDAEGTWRLWVVGPAREVHDLQLRYATAVLETVLAVFSRPEMASVSRNHVLLAATVGVVGGATDAARWLSPPAGMVLWPGRGPGDATAGEGKPAAEGEAVRQLKALAGIRPLFEEIIQAGARVGAGVVAGRPRRYQQSKLR